MGSTRFPGKPLAPILGKAMIQVVFERCAFSNLLDEVIIATCDQEIVDAAEEFGARAVMTSQKHERATERVAEAAGLISGDIYVLIQGDEPLITSEMIDAALTPLLAESSVHCVNLMRKIESNEDFLNPDNIKVVTQINGDALYMSRSPIPHLGNSNFSAINAYKQVCVMPMTAEILKVYKETAPTKSEVVESIDMLRLIENGIAVRMVETTIESYAVDRPHDVQRVEMLLMAERKNKD